MFDGVLASFCPKYQQLFVEMTGRDTFLPGDVDDPPAWHWPGLRGYTEAETSAVWERIKADPVFLLNLKPIAQNTSSLTLLLKTLERQHDIYYVTARVGGRAKRHTEIWLFEQLGYPMRVPGVWPTVIISSDKGAVAKALKLDVFVDDNLDNIRSVETFSPTTRAYLLNRRYNQTPDTLDGGREHKRRVNTLGEAFDAEIAAGNL